MNRVQSKNKDVLEAARMAMFLLSPRSEAAYAFRDELVRLTLAHEAQVAPRKRKRQKAAMGSFEMAVAAFSADLLLHSANDDAEGFMYRSSDKDELGMTLVSVKNFQMLINWWPQMGLMERVKGYGVQSTWEGDRITGLMEVAKASRYRATPELLKIAAGFGLSADALNEVHFFEDVSVVQSVRLRGTKIGGGSLAKPRTVPKSLLTTPAYRHQCERMDKLNEALRQHSFSLITQPLITRLFNNADHSTYGFNIGGRLMPASSGNWQNQSQEERLKLRINGEPVVEVDVRASHLFILHAMNEEPFDASVDPYRLEGISRYAVKKAVVTSLGSGKVPSKWARGFKGKHLEATGQPFKASMKTVYRALVAKYPIIARMRSKTLWGTLQFEESECFLGAMERLLYDNDCPALPVHDSLIVPESKAALCKTTIQRSYEQRFGQTPYVRTVRAG